MTTDTEALIQQIRDSATISYRRHHAVVSHRDMLKVHNAAAKRVYEVLRGKTRPGDVVVAV